MKTLNYLQTITIAAFLAAPHSFAADDLKLTMNWTADSAHLGFAMAQVRGFYSDAGLNVTLEEGRGSGVAAQMVATGQAELGYADAGAAMKVASQGAPIKIISTIWKSGQFGIQYLEKSGIKKPSDLKGKKIGVPPGSAMVPLMPLFLSANGLSEKDVTIVSAKQGANLGLLMKGEIDAVAETPENVVVPLAAEGMQAGNMYFYDNGVPLVSLSLIARQDRIEKDSDKLKRFLSATNKGWRAAMNDPEGAVDALLQVFPDTKKSRDALLRGATYSFSSVCPMGSGDKIGVTTPETWNNIYGVLTKALDFPTTYPIGNYFNSELLPEKAVLCP